MPGSGALTLHEKRLQKGPESHLWPESRGDIIEFRMPHFNAMHAFKDKPILQGPAQPAADTRPSIVPADREIQYLPVVGLHNYRRVFL